MGIGFNPVLIDHPEICVDIDEPKDYQFVKDLLEGEKQAARASAGVV